jgi:hypothetical protein
MLIFLTTGLRFRLAILLTALAALCFVMPPAALAFGHGEQTAHCLSHADMVDHGAIKGATANHHANHPAPADSHQTNCCGLFCLSALPAEIGEIVEGIAIGSALSPAPEPHLVSQSPKRPDKPPISSLFV